MGFCLFDFPYTYVRVLSSCMIIGALFSQRECESKKSMRTKIDFCVCMCEKNYSYNNNNCETGCSNLFGLFDEMSVKALCVNQIHNRITQSCTHTLFSLTHFVLDWNVRSLSISLYLLIVQTTQL